MNPEKKENGNSRRKAAFITARWIMTHQYPAEMLPQGPDRAFVQDLVYTTIRRFRPLRSILGQLVKTWPKGEMEALLLIGAAQILYMKDVPDFAAVNETVEAAKCCRNAAVAKVVNAVLRNLLRRREEFEAQLASAPLAERESFPNALVRRWIERYGVEKTAALCAYHNDPAETFIVRQDGIYEKVPRGVKIPELPGFAEGEFVVQDPATDLAVESAAVEPGMRVLDYCAAPGGKAIRFAWAAGAEGHVTAQEVNPMRLERLRENLMRVKAANVTAVARVPEAEAGTYDIVVVDAPCSNSGVLRRRPDARWNWTPQKLAELVTLQGEILQAASRFVKSGGRLVYSTCSNEPEENADQVKAFLASHPAFTCLSQRESLPFETGMDGAFAAVLELK